MVKFFLLKPAPFCMVFAGLGNTNKPATSLLFSFDLTLVLFSPPSFLLPQTLWQIFQGLFSFPSCCIRLPDTRFSRGTTRLMSWTDGKRYLRPLQSLVVSLFLSLGSFLALEAYCLIKILRHASSLDFH